MKRLPKVLGLSCCLMTFAAIAQVPNDYPEPRLRQSPAEPIIRSDDNLYDPDDEALPAGLNPDGSSTIERSQQDTENDINAPSPGRVYPSQFNSAVINPGVIYDRSYSRSQLGPVFVNPSEATSTLDDTSHPVPMGAGNNSYRPGTSTGYISDPQERNPAPPNVIPEQDILIRNQNLTDDRRRIAPE